MGASQHLVLCARKLPGEHPSLRQALGKLSSGTELLDKFSRPYHHLLSGAPKFYQNFLLDEKKSLTLQRVVR